MIKPETFIKIAKWMSKKTHLHPHEEYKNLDNIDDCMHENPFKKVSKPKLDNLGLKDHRDYLLDEMSIESTEFSLGNARTRAEKIEKEV